MENLGYFSFQHLVTLPSIDHFRTSGFRGSVVVPYAIEEDAGDEFRTSLKGEVIFLNGETVKMIKVRLLPHDDDLQKIAIFITLGNYFLLTLFREQSLYGWSTV